LSPLSPAPARPTLASTALTRVVVLLALSMAYFAYVFRIPSGEWLRMGLGDWIDPYFINSVLEDWHYSLAHLTSPASPPVFFPVRGTLGYSHSLVLYAPFYVIARLWLHPFTAHTVTLFAVIELGTLCLYVVFRSFAGLGFAEALVFTAVFATSGNVISGGTGVWSQRASIFLVPPILLLGLWSAGCLRGRRRAVGLACSGFLAATLLTQDIYTGLLTALVVALLIVGARLIFQWPRVGIRLVIWRRSAAPVSLARRRALWACVMVIAIALVWAWAHEYNNLLGIPLDIRHRHPGRALAVAVIAAVAVELLRGGVHERVTLTDSAVAADLAALAAGALAGFVVFVWMYAGAYSQHHRFPAEELLEHLTPIALVPFDTGRSLVMVFVLAAAAWLPWLRLPRQVRLFSLWFVLATLVILVLPVRIGRFALWTYISNAVPGFAAIRDPRRLQFPFELAAALATGLLAAQMPRDSWSRRAVLIFVVVVVVVKWNGERFDYERPREIFRQFVEAPIAIDASCRSFFVTGAESAAYRSRSPNTWALYANDAAFIARRYALPTLNGYSAWTPPDWHLFNPEAPDYPAAVADWISLHRLEHVCALDIERRTMTPF
jgi:hypothetical protein